MHSIAPAIPVVIIVFVSALTRSALGFGDALIAMPLLALIVSVQTASPLVALMSGTAAVSLLLRNWRSADFKAAWRLILSSSIGIPLGLYYLKASNESLAKAVLGALLVAFGLYNLIGPRIPTLHSEKPAYAFGLLAGILGGAYNTKGPPVVIYGALRGWSPESFRATLQCYFLPTTLMVVVSHGLGGLWTPTVLKLYAYALPAIAVGTYLGGKVNRFIPRGQFNRLIYAFLTAIGLLLILRA
jgi:uncharacterized membrane protein YfcA